MACDMAADVDNTRQTGNMRRERLNGRHQRGNSSAQSLRSNAERIDTLVRRTSISLVARNEIGELIGVCFRITDFAYWLFITDLGVVRECVGQGVGKALVKQLHDLAGGEKNIIMYTCVNEDAVPFYEKIGMTVPDDVMVYNHVDWADFTVE